MRHPIKILTGAALAGFVAIGAAQAQELGSIQAASNGCGNNGDPAARMLACSEVIAHPQAKPSDLGYAYWHRAYVGCVTETAPKHDSMADLMASARADPEGWKRQYGVSHEGSNETLWPVVHRTVLKWVNGICRN